MIIKTIFSGEIFSHKRLVRRIPLAVVACMLTLIYIAAGYNMQHLKQRENNLKNTYKKLHASAISVHQKMVKEMSIENIQLLIDKYGLTYLNISTEPIVPIEVKND